jgi:nucleoside-diphosphate-sugar epimerase
MTRVTLRARTGFVEVTSRAPWAFPYDSVRALCGFCRCSLASCELTLARMTADVRPTTFVTGAAGFIGLELVKVLVARGHPVFGLTGSLDGAQRVRNAGATAVMGNLLEPGQWQDEVAADWVFHLPPRPQEAAGATWTRAATLSRARVLMDGHLLDAVAAGATRRIVYVADTSCYGATGPRPITEDEPVQPSPWGRCLAPAFNRLDGYIAAGLPIVTAFVGWAYGNASWFRKRVIEPVMAGRRVLQFGNSGPWVSPIHVHDCARALVHVAERGEVGGRYFLVNTDPIRMDEFAEAFARLANRPLRVWRVPSAARRLVQPSTLSDSPRADAVFSNVRLRGIGFRFQYPTLEQGLGQVMGALHEQSI